MELITICAWCEKMKNEDGDWIEKKEGDYQITHGICEKCTEQVEGDIKKHKKLHT